jgi:hypothetical protein
LSAVCYLAAALLTAPLADRIWLHNGPGDVAAVRLYQIFLSLSAWGTGGGIAAALLPTRNSWLRWLLWVSLAMIQAIGITALWLVIVGGVGMLESEAAFVLVFEAIGAALATLLYLSLAGLLSLGVSG